MSLWQEQCSLLRCFKRIAILTVGEKRAAWGAALFVVAAGDMEHSGGE